MIQNELQEKLFGHVVTLLQQKGFILKKGSIVDSTLIEAPSSTKNREKQRDPDAHQAKKGNQWHFRYKAHIGVDKDSGLVQKVKVTAANVSDVATMPELLTGEEEIVYGDRAISAWKSARVPSSRTSRAREFDISSTVVHHRSRTVRCGPRVNVSAGSAKSPPFELRSSTCSPFSKVCSDTEKYGTEDWQNRSRH